MNSIYIHNLVLLIFSCESDKGVVVYNTPPEANIISHENASEVFEGYPVEFRAALSDVNHNIDQLTARWKVSGEEVCPFLPPDQNGESVCVATIGDGADEISVEVRDPENASGSDSIFLSVVPTEEPQAFILRPQEFGVFYSDFPIIFEGLISDNEDDVTDLQYEWSSSIDGLLDMQSTVESDGTVKGNMYLSEGHHVITLRVEDKTEKADSDEVTITVGGPNSNPTCEITVPQSGIAVPVGEMIDFQGLANDVDIDDNLLSVEWTSNKMEGILGISPPNSSGDVLFSYADLTVDTHTITMTVTDEKGATCSDFISVAVGTPPSVTIESPTSGIYNEGETITFLATVSDNEDQPNEISLEWTTSGGTVLNSQSATSNGNVEFVLNDMTYGQQVITLTGTDTDGLTASDLVSFTINALPTQPSLTVLPENPKTGDDITATATGSTDADGGNVTYTYEWVYGSNTVNGSILSSSETAKGQEWTVTATPNDGTADGPSISQTVTIGNTAPDSLVVTITPNSGIYNDSELICSATANDVDTADTLEYSYEWSTGDTTQTIVLDGTLQSGDTITCMVVVTDGTEDISNEAYVVIENTIPVVDDIVLSPNLVYTNDTIQATVTLSDNDTSQNGSLTASYEWHVIDVSDNNNDRIITSVSSNTLFGGNPDQHFGKGDQVYVVVIPNDGVANGNPVVSNSITIQNSISTQPEVQIYADHDPAVAGIDDLICQIVTPAMDDDPEDNLSYDFTWTDAAGNTQQNTYQSTDVEDVFGGANTSSGLWTCEVTPYDDEDYGDSQNATYLVGTQCLDMGEVLHMDFDTGSPEDISTTGHVIHIENSEPTVDRFGIGNQAWRFYPDVNSRLRINSHPSLTFWDSFSVSMYVKFNEPWVFHAESLVWKFEHPSLDGYHLAVDQNNSAYGNGMYQLSFSVPSAQIAVHKILSYEDISNWFHVVGTFDQGHVSLYLNGVLVAEDFGLSTMVDSDHDVFLGGSSHPVSGAYHRDIDDVRIHNCALSEEEVLGLYNIDADGDGVPMSTDCDDSDSSVQSSFSGATQNCAAESCMEILDEGFGTGDGIYWINPDRSGAFEVYCDMTTDGGGWTLIGSFNNGDGVYNWTQYGTGANNLSNWTNDSTFGNLSDMYNADYKSKAFSTLEASEMLIMDSNASWLSIENALQGTMVDTLLQYTTCQSQPISGTTMRSSDSDFANYAQLIYYGEDPNRGNSCALQYEELGTDSSVISFVGSGCGTHGLGHLGWQSPAGHQDSDSNFCLSGLGPLNTDTTWTNQVPECIEWNGIETYAYMDPVSCNYAHLFVK